MFHIIWLYKLLEAREQTPHLSHSVFVFTFYCSLQSLEKQKYFGALELYIQEIKKSKMIVKFLSLFAYDTYLHIHEVEKYSLYLCFRLASFSHLPIFLLKIRSQKAPLIGPGIKLRGDDVIMPGPGWLLFCRCSSNSNTSNYTKSHNKWETLNSPTKAKKYKVSLILLL